MVAEVFAGIGAFKAMFDLAKGLKDIDDRATRNAIAIELQEKILSAQVQQAALIEKVGTLEKEVTQLKAWEGEKERYELQDLRSGFFAYIPKTGEERGEPPHALCANCYQRGIKSILQCNGSVDVHKRSWNCPHCRTAIPCQWNDLPELIRRCREGNANE